MTSSTDLTESSQDNAKEEKDKLALEEIMFRQIHPEWVEDGHPTSQGFRPTPKDDDQLSIDRSTIFTAEQSFDLHVKIKGLKSYGSYGVSVAEFLEQGIRCMPDPILDKPENPAHALANYSGHSSSKQKVIAKKLKEKAVSRGRLHPS